MALEYECSNCGYVSGSKNGPCNGCKLSAPRRIDQNMSVSKEIGESMVRAACITIASLGSCKHCRIAADSNDTFEAQWFFLDRARACVHLDEKFRKLAREATEATTQPAEVPT